MHASFGYFGGIVKAPRPAGRCGAESERRVEPGARPCKFHPRRAGQAPHKDRSHERKLTRDPVRARKLRRRSVGKPAKAGPRAADHANRDEIEAVACGRGAALACPCLARALRFAPAAGAARACGRGAPANCVACSASSRDIGEAAAAALRGSPYHTRRSAGLHLLCGSVPGGADLGARTGRAAGCSSSRAPCLGSTAIGATSP